MLRYNGHGNTESVVIAVLGDGASKTLRVDLRKPPFQFDFQGHFPVDYCLFVQDGPVPEISLSGAVVTLAYPEPLEVPTSESGFSPRSQFQLVLLYKEAGSSKSIARDTKRKKRKR